jgi:hypothetical protein
MVTDLLKSPTKEGVYGPEILLNCVSGQACLRFEDGTTRGNAPGPPCTNAFFVWVGRPVIVVSEGVQAPCTAAVAESLRTLAGAPDVPVVFNLGRLDGKDGVRVISVPASSNPRPDLARAEAYVMVQCAWHEGGALAVELDGRLFNVRIEFRQTEAGGYFPHVME